MIRRNPRVVSQRLAGEKGTVLLHLDTSGYFSLNIVGALIWDHIDEAIPVDLLRQRISAQFGSAPESLDADLSDFIEELSRRDLIEITDTGTFSGSG